MNKNWNDGLAAVDYWNKEFISVAPLSLAISYQKLKEYVTDGNIGCTLFLIRDVFELMIKIPVTIMFDGVHTLYYLDQLFRKYVPDMEVLLSDFCNNIPSDFDLNCIFEDDFE